MTAALTLLVNPPYQAAVRSVAQTTVGPPMGLAYLAGALEEAGRPVKVLDANALGMTVQQTAAEIVQSGAAVLGLTGSTPTIDLCDEIARRAHDAGFRGAFVIGGPHASNLLEETLAAYPVFDVAVAGEAENRIVALVDALAANAGLDDIPGIAHRTEAGVTVTGMAPPPPDVDTLPGPARHLLPLHRYFCPDGRQSETVIANRGCPAPCSYCSVPQYFGRKIRRRRVDDVADEIQRLHRERGITWINFIDDTFTWDGDWVEALCAALHSRGLPGKVEWQCLTRVDRVEPVMLQRMHDAGCRRVEMGIEVGHDRGVKVLRKKIDRPTVLNAFRHARAAGLETLAFAMVNVPDETLDEIAQTSALLREADPDYLQLSYCTPYPGTKLYEDAVREGRLRSTDWADYRFLRRPVLDNGVLTETEVVAAHLKVLREFWLRPKTVARMARRLVERPEARRTTLHAAWQGVTALAGFKDTAP